MPSKRRGRPRRQSARLQRIDPSASNSFDDSQDAEPSSRRTSNDQLYEIMEFDEHVHVNKNSLVKNGGESKKAVLLNIDAGLNDTGDAIDSEEHRLARNSSDTAIEGLPKRGSHAAQGDMEINSSKTKSPGFEAPVVLQCATCRTIFADTTNGFLQTNTATGTISFASVRSVELSEDVETETSGAHSNCTFLKMECKQCGQTVGRKFVSTTTDFDDIRDVFTFDKKCIITYRTGSCSPATLTSAEGNAVQASVSDPSLAAIRSLQEQLSAVGESVNSLADWMQAMESDNTQFRQDILAWEERVQRLERMTAHFRSLSFKDINTDSEAQT